MVVDFVPGEDRDRLFEREPELTDEGVLGASTSRQSVV